jgi:hypothetical protein
MHERNPKQRLAALLRQKGFYPMLRAFSKACLAAAAICALVSPGANAAVKHRHHIYRSHPEFYSSWANHENAMRIPRSIPNADSYQSFDGSYYSHADEVRSIEGTPCGVACEASHEQ